MAGECKYQKQWEQTRDKSPYTWGLRGWYRELIPIQILGLVLGLMRPPDPLLVTEYWVLVRHDSKDKNPNPTVYSIGLFVRSRMDCPALSPLDWAFSPLL